MRVKVWPTGTSEPEAWLATETDGTAALQGPAGIALKPYLSGSSTTSVTYSVDNLLHRRTP